MRRFLKVIWFILIAVFISTGCQLTPPMFNKLGYQKIDEANAKIEKIETDAAKRIAELQESFNKKTQELMDNQTLKLQGAANELFAANYTHTLDLTPDRNSIVVNYHVKAAQEYIKLPPTAEAIQKYLVDIKTELDEKVTSLDDLQKKFEKEKAKADNLEADKVRISKELETIKTDKKNIEETKNDAVKKLQLVKDKNIKKILNDQQQALEDEKDRKELIETLMYWTGAITVIAIIAAVYLPRMKTESTLVAAIFGGITIALPFVEGWMIAIGGGSAIALVIAWMLYRHHADMHAKQQEVDVQTNTNKNIINAIQDVKEKAKDVYDATIKPALTEWNTVVTHTPDGQTVKVEDKTVTNAIEQTLINSDRK